MKIHTGLARLGQFKGSRVLTLGVFDGMHRGHRKVVRTALRLAKTLGHPLTAVTFYPHPRAVLASGRARLLFNLHHRLRQLADCGVPSCVVMKFDRRMARMSPGSFVRKILIRKLKAKGICVGSNFRFGAGGRGDIRLLRRFEAEGFFKVVEVKPVRLGGGVVSSTRIRELIGRGHLMEASRLTGRRISLFGEVIRGEGRGRRMGFPTVNLDLHHEALPPEGIYAARVKIGTKTKAAAVHIGPRPTFGEKDVTVEAYIMDFHNSIYGKQVELFLIKRLRGIHAYPDMKTLRKQIVADVRQIKRMKVLSHLK